jgi:hypothetical protein
MVGSQIGDTYPMMEGGGASSGFGIAAARIVIRNAAAELQGAK